MKRVVTIKVEDEYENRVAGYSSREYHIPLDINSADPSTIVDGLDKVIIEKGWLR